MSDQQEFILPAVKVIDNAFNGCKEFIDEVLATDGWVGGQVGTHGNSRLSTEVRDVSVLLLDRKLTSPVSWYLIARGMMMHALEYAREYGYGIRNMEQPQVLHYSSDPDNRQFYKPHVDTDHEGKSNERDFSAVLYLNTVEEGGDTVFTYFGAGVQPVEGRIVFFPANYAYMHEALPPISEDKFAVVTWFTFGSDKTDNNHNHSDHDGHDHGMEFLKFES